MQPDLLNAPRWNQAPRSGFNEAWYVVASDPRAGHGLWLRYTVDVDRSGEPAFALWGSWFEEGRLFALKNTLPAAAIGRRGVAFGAGELTADGCSGEVEGAGHALRWRLRFGQGSAGEEFVPSWLAAVARLRGGGFVLPHPATTVTGAVEVDGRIIELQRVPAGQAHLWGRTRYPSWAWARCSAFAEDPDASLDLLDVEGPAGLRVPLFIFRFRGETHRFGELPWIGLSTSQPRAPSWHFSAQDARIAIDGVAQVSPERMVQVQYQEPTGSVHHCVNSELASLEVRVRTRAFPGVPWRPEATLISKGGASLEFCGRGPDPRVRQTLVSRPRNKRRRRPPVPWQADGTFEGTPNMNRTATRTLLVTLGLATLAACVVNLSFVMDKPGIVLRSDAGTTKVTEQKFLVSLADYKEVNDHKDNIKSFDLDYVDVTITSVDPTNTATSVTGTVTLRKTTSADPSGDIAVGSLTSFPLAVNKTVRISGTPALDAFLLQQLQSAGQFYVVVNGAIDKGVANVTVDFNLHVSIGYDAGIF